MSTSNRVVQYHTPYATQNSLCSPKMRLCCLSPPPGEGWNRGTGSPAAELWWAFSFRVSSHVQVEEEQGRSSIAFRQASHLSRCGAGGNHVCDHHGAKQSQLLTGVLACELGGSVVLSHWATSSTEHRQSLFVVVWYIKTEAPYKGFWNSILEWPGQGYTEILGIEPRSQHMHSHWMLL